MTRPSHASRTRAPRRFGALLATFALLAPAAPVLAAVDEPVDPLDEAVTLTVAPGSDGVLADGQDLFLTVAADNPSASVTVGGTVTVSLGRTALTGRDDVAAWLGEGTGATDLPQIATTTLDVLPPEGSRASSFVASPAETGADSLPAGVYPLQATLALGDGETVSATSVVVIPADTATGQVAVVAPITAPALEEGLLTAVELADLTAPGGALRAQLDAVAATNAILAIDPAIVAAIRVLGSTAPASATAWLDELLALENDRFALQFGDADVAVQAAAGRTSLLEVPSLSPYLEPTGFAAPTPTPTVSPEPSKTPAATSTPGTQTPGTQTSGTETPGATPTPTPTVAVLPDPTDTATFFDIGTADTTVYWPATASAGPADVAALSAMTDAEGERPWVLLPTPAGTGGTAHGVVDGAPVLSYDAEISAALRTASEATEFAERGAALAAASAYSALAGAADPDGTILVTPDRAADRSLIAYRDTINAAAGLTGRTAVDLDAITALPADPTTVEPVDPVDPVDPEPARLAVLDQFAAAEESLAAFATILDDPTLITARERATTLQLLGNAWRESPESWTDALDSHRTATTATLASVAIVPPSAQTLLGSSAPMRFTVRNDLPWPVSLVLFAQPADLRLVVQGSTPVTAGPAQNTRVEVPVRSRVASGDSSIDLQLRSPSMVSIGDEVTVDVAVRAEWENVGIVVMIVLVAGLIITGIFRTVTRIRRRGRETGSELASKDGRADG